MNADLNERKIELDSQQPLRISAEDLLVVVVGDAHGLQTFQHFGNAADLVWIVGAGKDLAGAGEADGQLKRAGIEVDSIVIKFFEIGAGRARDVFAAVGKSFIAAVEAFGEIRDGAAEVSEDPFDVGKALSHAAEDETGGGERGVHEEADERHEPVVEHGFYANRICRMNMNDSTESIRGFPQRPETLMAERCAVDVAENHYAGKLELLHGAAQLNDGRGGITERQSGKRGEASALGGDDAGESVIDQAGEPDGGGRGFDVRAGRSESDDLSINAGVFENLLAIFDVAMAGHGDVEIARIVQTRIAVGIVGDPNRAGPLFESFDVFRWIEMIMKVDRRHPCLVLWLRAESYCDAPRKNTLAAPEEASRDQ